MYYRLDPARAVVATLAVMFVGTALAEEGTEFVYLEAASSQLHRSRRSRRLRHRSRSTAMSANVASRRVYASSTAKLEWPCPNADCSPHELCEQLGAKFDEEYRRVSSTHCTRTGSRS